jgi:hypothetical protein
VGRFSYRETGRFLSEKACAETKSGGSAIQVLFDSKSAPKPPSDLYFDRNLVYKNLGLIRQQTSLASFRFGSQDYDRWAIVYGRIEVHKGATPPSKPKAAAGEFEPVPANLVCSSDTMVVFLRD